MVRVEVRMKFRGEDAWTAWEVPPEDYFWKLAERPWSIESEPEHLHVARLVPDKRIEFAAVRVMDTELASFQERAYHYWGGPEDYACIVTWNRGGSIERELIFSGRTPCGANGSQVIRIALDGDVPRTTAHSFSWGKGGDEHTDNMLRAPAV